jgi:hypothetical protein
VDEKRLLAFGELVLIQEPGEGGQKFIESITKALKNAEYKGAVRVVSLAEKDPRALWLMSGKNKAQFTEAFESGDSGPWNFRIKIDGRRGQPT